MPRGQSKPSSGKRDTLENMTREEFQSKLYECFEEKGVLSGLRTRLRHQMIQSLKKIDKKASLSQKLNQNLSPKLQAVNLLIAEYLLRQRYNYSLSVFSSEVPMLSSFPSFVHPKTESIEADDENPFDEWNPSLKFKDKDVWDILQALGLPEDMDQAKKIHTAYDIDSDTLLICLIRMLPAALRKNELGNKIKDGESNEQTVERNSSNILLEVLSQISDRNVSKNATLKLKDAKIKSDNVLGSTKCVNGCNVEHVQSNLDVSNGNQPESVDTAVLESMMEELHGRMQKAFDYELEVARKSEWQKCRDVIENMDREMLREIDNAKDKLKKMEARLQNRFQKELETEKQRLAESSKVREMNLEREMERELEIERRKLLEEYRQVLLNKKGDISGLLNLQQSSLGVALETVQQQSNRLREKEDLLNKRLSDLNNDFKFYEQHESKETNDAASQTFLFEEEEAALSNARIAIDKLKAELENKRKCINQNKTQTVDKEVQTPAISLNTTQTNTDEFRNSSCNDGKSSKNGKTRGSDKPCYDSHKRGIGVTEIDSATNILLEKNIRNVDGSENPLQYVLKTLHNENLHLKSLTFQHKSQIKELVAKQVSMGREASEANLQVKELSTQLAQLGNLMSKNEAETSRYTKPGRTRMRSAPGSMRRKNSGIGLDAKKNVCPISNKPFAECRKYGCDGQEGYAATSRQTRNCSTGRLPGKHERNNKHNTKKYETSSSDEDNLDDIIKHRNRILGSVKKISQENGNKLNNDDGDSSPTDHVLKDVRKRLKRFERESEAVNNSYQEFKKRQSEGLFDKLSANIEDVSQSKTFIPMKDIPASAVCHSENNYNTNTIPLSLKEPKEDFLDHMKYSQPGNIHWIPSDPIDLELPQRYEQRRAHAPSMNIDKSVLQNYIETAQKMRQYSAKNPKSFADSLLRNHFQKNNWQESHATNRNNFQGTTSFLMKRIENSMASERKKYGLIDDNNCNYNVTSTNKLNVPVLNQKGTYLSAIKNNEGKLTSKNIQKFLPRSSWTIHYQNRDKTMSSSRKNIVVLAENIDINSRGVSDESDFIQHVISTKADSLNNLQINDEENVQQKHDTKKAESNELTATDLVENLSLTNTSIVKPTKVGDCSQNSLLLLNKKITDDDSYLSKREMVRKNLFANDNEQVSDNSKSIQSDQSNVVLESNIISQQSNKKSDQLLKEPAVEDTKLNSYKNEKYSHIIEMVKSHDSSKQSKCLKEDIINTKDSILSINEFDEVNLNILNGTVEVEIPNIAEAKDEFHIYEEKDGALQIIDNADVVSLKKEMENNNEVYNEEIDDKSESVDGTLDDLSLSEISIYHSNKDVNDVQFGELNKNLLDTNQNIEIKDNEDIAKIYSKTEDNFNIDNDASIKKSISEIVKCASIGEKVENGNTNDKLIDITEDEIITDVSVGRMDEKINSAREIFMSDNGSNHVNLNANVLSDRQLVPSSLEISNHSSLSIAHISDDNDSFW